MLEPPIPALARTLSAAVLALALAACDRGAPAADDAPVAARATAEAAADEATPEPDRAATAGILPQMLGVWDYEKGTCDLASDLRLTIANDRFTFYESSGTVEAVRRDGDAIIVDLAMTGEGESWTQSYRLVLRDAGQRLHVTDPADGTAVDDYPRKRCPA